ncbi:DUF1987 domain-containing protein [Labilibacter marinus]|uniref:DUF1987 domain-containing protein n=1 Tax=Labilibacter marinus TaxID=1477105 RepID=UPI00082ACDCA|nr:DUF1987 domain-containing protein [Labilibacter marinus]
MRKLTIDSTPNSPKIWFDTDKSIFEVSGESRPENASIFYKNVIDWVIDFESSLTQQGLPDKTPYTFNFNLEYFNSTSAKFILDFLKKLGHLHSLGHQIVIRWHYEDDDEDMLEVGQEMSKMSKISFEFIELKV